MVSVHLGGRSKSYNNKRLFLRKIVGNAENSYYFCPRFLTQTTENPRCKGKSY